MTPKQFIEKAIEGGWQPFSDTKVRKGFEVEENEVETMIIFYDKVNVRRYSLPLVVLNPLAWQAVGKVEGWGTPRDTHKWITTESGAIICDYCVCLKSKPDKKCKRNVRHWKDEMHRMIEALAGGRSNKEFLKTL